MKQYVLMCDENGKELLQRVIGGIQMLEVMGLSAGEGNAQYNLLVTPVAPQIESIPTPKIMEEPQNEQ